MRSSRNALLALALVASVAGCTVDDSSLNTALFPCTNDAACGQGWGCKRATPYASDFCAARCVPGDPASCDGICTADDLCLPACRIDESTSACPSDGYSCIRTSIDSTTGICYPVTVCDAVTDCAPGEACLSTDFELTKLYCIPTSETSSCGAGSRSLADVIPGASPYCLATCADVDSVCPPGFGCLTQLRFFRTDTATPPLCFPGVAGVACADDTNCLVGRCLNTGPGGKVCTITCNEASRLYGAAGCSAASAGNLFEEFFSMECDPTADGGREGGLCSVHYDIGWVGCTPPGGAYPCVTSPAGTACVAVNSGGMEINVCTGACTTSSECNRGTSDRNYCAGITAGMPTGFCVPRAGPGVDCLIDEGCRSMRCVRMKCT